MNPLQSLVLHPLAQTLGWTLLHFLWQGALLGLLAWLTLYLLRGADAKARYGVACAFLVLMVAAPVGTFQLLQQPGSHPATLYLTAEATASTAAPAPLAQRMKASLDPALPWLLLGWAAGVLLLSTRFLGSWIRVQRLRRHSATPVAAEWHLILSRLCRELKLSRTVRLLQSAAVEVPTALGWLRPVILLPACALSGLAPLQLEAILAHELAHIRRGDFLVNLLQSLVEVLLFYHPAVWWLSARIRAERELCCDDVAAELCGDPLLLAKALTDLEALRVPIPTPTPLAMAANGGSLMHRVRHLLHPALPITSGARATALAVLAASLLGAAGVALRDQEGAEKTTRIRTVDGKRELDVRLKGDVKLNGEAPEPVSIPGDGSFRVEEKRAGKTRVYAATKAKATYTVDGREKALDKEGQEWLRGIVTESAKAQAGREQARRLKIHTELDRAGSEKERLQAEGRQERRVEFRTRDMETQERALDARSNEMEARMEDLERRAKSATPEDRAKLKGEADLLKAEGAKLKADGERWRVEADRIKNDPEMKALIAAAEKEGRRVHMEVIKKHGEGPGKDGKPRNVVIRRYQVQNDGMPGQDHDISIFEHGDELATAEGIETNLHIPPIQIPRIHVRTFAHGEDDDPRAEMAELQAEMKALQARLEQLQEQLAKPPKPGKAPLAPLPPLRPHVPKSALPAPPPPPPPPAPLAPPAPEAPPAPPAPPAEVR